MTATFIGGAHNFNVHAANLTSIGNRSNKALQSLSENICAAAIHDSEERCDSPKCHPETRVAVQNETITWIARGDRDDNPKRMRWINGPAGAGKTAVLGSVTERCHEQGLLAASFFFSSTSATFSRRSKRQLVPTIAYQLAQHPSLHFLMAPITSAAEAHPDIFMKKLNTQAESLILGPLRQVCAGDIDQTDWPKAIIVDGLDECQAEQYRDSSKGTHSKRRDGDDQLEVLQTLLKLLLDPIFPFRILIASRPDPAIHAFFEGEGILVTNVTVLDDTLDPDKDIARFLEARFSDIRRRHHLPASWPAPDVVPTLLSNASGHFAYPSVVMRFVVDDSSPLSPIALLDIVMGVASAPVSSTHPLAPLDAMYTAILNSSPDPLLSVVWIHAIRWVGRDPRRPRPAMDTNELLESVPGEAIAVLGSLRSLIYIPPFDDEETSYSFHHKSFLDFLHDPKRSRSLFVDKESGAEDHTFSNFLMARYLQVVVLDKEQFQASKEHSLRQTSFALGSLLFNDWERFTCSTDWLRHFSKELLSCDATWWTWRNMTLRNSASISKMFTVAHAKCPLYRCTAVCKHWRSGILKICKAARWRVPTRAQLYRDRLVHQELILDPFIRSNGSQACSVM